MSTSESGSSMTSNHSASDEELYGAYGGDYLPYLNEPLASTDDEGDDGPRPNDGEQPEDEDGISPETFRERQTGNLTVDQWCVCGKCSAANLESAREYRCCHEVAPAYGKVVFNGQSDEIKCVTLHEDYRAFTNINVLRNVGPLLRKKDGKPYKKRANVTENEYLRAVSYRWLARWIFGYMGWDNTRPLPACIYHNVREKFMSNQKIGYKNAEERN